MQNISFFGRWGHYSTHFWGPGNRDRVVLGSQNQWFLNQVPIPILPVPRSHLPERS